MMHSAVYLMPVSFVVLFGVIIRLVVTEISITFEASPETNYRILEGSIVHMLCLQEEHGGLFISFKGSAIVENSNLVGSQSKYNFSQAELGNTFIFTIREVAKGDNGRYYCAEGQALVKQLYLDVLYHPTRGPNCVSSYGALTSYFDDIFQEKFQFNCTGEDGNPPIDIMLFKYGELREKVDLDGITVIKSNGYYPEKTITFSTYLDSSFNNSRFICNVFQDMSSALMGYDFNKMCSYGPMVWLPSFDISITPSNVTVITGGEARVTCNSNVSSVEKRWLSIPQDLEYEIVQDEYGLHMEILEMKGVENQSITVFCEVTYGHRRLSEKATLYKVQDDSIPNKASSFSVVVVVVVVLASVIYLYLV